MRNIKRLSLLGLSALIIIAGMSMEIAHLRGLLQATTQVASGNLIPVEKKMEDLRSRAFCHNLNGWVDSYLAEVNMHNSIAQVYNDAVLRDPSTKHHVEPLMERGVISNEAINGLISIARINPWQDCVQRHRIYRKS